MEHLQQKMEARGDLSPVIDKMQHYNVTIGLRACTFRDKVACGMFIDLSSDSLTAPCSLSQPNRKGNTYVQVVSVLEGLH